MGAGGGVNPIGQPDRFIPVFFFVDFPYQEVIAEIGKDTQSSPNQLYNASAFLGEITQTKAELDEMVTSTETGKVQQKVRVCEENENLFRLCLLLGLLVVIALAAYSIYKLHTIADYEV